MANPQLAIFGYSEAAMFLGGSPPPDVKALISIHGAREFGVEANVEHRLDLAFDDIEVVKPDDVMSLQRAMSRKRWAEQSGLREVAPQSSDAAAVIAFAKETAGVDGVMLCHCGGGMSRAPAAALICLSVWRGVGSEHECVADVLRLRRGAVPHVGLIGFADQLLQRDNALVRAVIAAKY